MHHLQYASQIFLGLGKPSHPPKSRPGRTHGRHPVESFTRQPMSAYATAGIWMPYLALIAAITAFAMIFCPAADGCDPSRENSAPNGAVAASRVLLRKLGTAGMTGGVPAFSGA